VGFENKMENRKKENEKKMKNKKRNLVGSTPLPLAQLRFSSLGPAARCTSLSP
jgi:hypothetical protein